MKQEVQNSIDALSKLDLSKYPYDEARKLIGELGKFASILVDLHPGKTIMRARPNYNGEHFTKASQYSFKPQEFNKTYQRASTPNMTMFYGCVIPDKREEGELDNTRMIGALEALPWLRSKTTKGFQKISFGRWIVKKDITLLAVVQHENYFKESSYTRELVTGFKEFTKHYPELEEETILISDYFAKEFAKEDTANDFDYLLSAAFTQMVVEKGLDGVIYPSVRVGGKGFNVALRPEIANENLELVVAGECSIYKYLDQTMVDNETAVKLEPNQIEFELLPVEAKYHAGSQECLRRIGLSLMSELLN